MANYSPESSQNNMPIDFRAPPPSPVAAGRRSSFTNNEVLTNFLEHSLRVPDLVLPDRVFPRQKPIQTPPKLDWEVLNSSGSADSISELLESISRIGCFELVNHNISSDLIRLATNSGAGIFKLIPEQKAKISRSNERSYGFVEFHGGEERETSEEFVWCKDQALKLEMEGIWPTGYSNFSESMEMLMLEIEKVAASVLQSLQQKAPRKSTFDDFGTIQEEEITAGSIVYLYKHSACIEEEEMTSSSLRYDVIRMLIRGSESSHALCLHLCDGSSEFHVYSKKGWVSFCPDREALVITIGDQLQAWSGGEYKHVIGRPIFKSEEEEEEEEEEDCNISMAFLYSPPPNSIITNTNTSRVIIKDVNAAAGKNTISLVHQLILALIFTLFYNVRSFLCPKS